MSRFRIVRSIDIHFAHQIRGHAGACINIHGHTWKFELIIESKKLDSQGFVVDFGDLSKEILQPCYKMLDHSLVIGEDTFREIQNDLVSMGSKLVAVQRKKEGHTYDERTSSEMLLGARNEWPGGMKVTVFPFNPTSERLAEWFFLFSQKILNHGEVMVSGVRIYETLHPVASYAEYWSE